jgi:hypothetical protein
MLARLRQRRTMLTPLLVMAVVWSASVPVGASCCSGECAAVCGGESPKGGMLAAEKSLHSCCALAVPSGPSSCRCPTGCPCCGETSVSDVVSRDRLSGSTISMSGATAACTCGPTRGSVPVAPAAQRDETSAGRIVSVSAVPVPGWNELSSDLLAGHSGLDNLRAVADRPCARVRCCVWTI